MFVFDSNVHTIHDQDELESHVFRLSTFYMTTRFC
jgi:hypothetical protein